MKNTKLKDLLVMKVNVLYDVETSILKALPKVIKAVADPGLKKALRRHLEETRNHVIRIEEVCAILDGAPKKLESDAIRGLIKDSEWVIKNIRPNKARDATLARALQYVEHYEMAGYMGAIAWAEELEEEVVADILKETLEEEQEADRKLDQVGDKLQKEII